MYFAIARNDFFAQPTLNVVKSIVEDNQNNHQKSDGKLPLLRIFELSGEFRLEQSGL
jgi:hypothetical protein